MVLTLSTDSLWIIVILGDILNKYKTTPFLRDLQSLPCLLYYNPKNELCLKDLNFQVNLCECNSSNTSLLLIAKLSVNSISNKNTPICLLD